MTLRQLKLNLKKVKLGQITYLDVWYFVQGHFRYFMIHTFFLKLFIRPKVKQEIVWRYSVVDSECLSNRRCKHCGCQMPQFIYCNKSCEGNCYPTLNTTFNHKKNADTKIK